MSSSLQSRSLRGDREPATALDVSDATEDPRLPISHIDDAVEEEEDSPRSLVGDLDGLLGRFVASSLMGDDGDAISARSTSSRTGVSSQAKPMHASVCPRRIAAGILGARISQIAMSPRSAVEVVASSSRTCPLGLR